MIQKHWQNVTNCLLVYLFYACTCGRNTPRILRALWKTWNQVPAGQTTIHPSLVTCYLLLVTCKLVYLFYACHLEGNRTVARPKSGSAVKAQAGGASTRSKDNMHCKHRYRHFQISTGYCSLRWLIDQETTVDFTYGNRWLINILLALWLYDSRHRGFRHPVSVGKIYRRLLVN